MLYEVIRWALFGTWVAAIMLGMIHGQYGLICIGIALGFLDFEGKKRP